MADWQGFYTARQLARLSGIPLRTLQRWRAQGIIAPSLEMVDGAKVIKLGYSYADLTIARLLGELRQGRIDFRSASIVLHHLYERLGPPSRGWADAHVYFKGNRIYAEHPDHWGTTEATRHGQVVETRAFGELFEELRLRDLEEGVSIVVPVQFRKYVEIDPKIMGGEPVVAGMRIPTSVLAEFADHGQTIEELSRTYKPIKPEYLAKAIEYEHFLDKKSPNVRAVAAGH